MIRLEDFLPEYPSINDPYFQQKLYNKEEFYKYRLNREQEELDPSGYLNQQIIGAHFMSSHTEYDGLLVFHQQGVGKTCFAHAVAEELRKSGSYKRCIVLARGRDLLINIMRSFVYSCLKDVAIQKKKFKDSRAEVAAIRKMLKTFYSFNTFLVFSREIALLSDEQIVSRFSNTIIIVDEVHNISAADAKNEGVYPQVHRLFHLAQNCKKLIMSATPMSDEVAEIATIMNLILPKEEQLPTGTNFEKEYLEEQADGTFTVTPNASSELKRKFAGRISYLVARVEDIDIVYDS